MRKIIVVKDQVKKSRIEPSTVSFLKAARKHTSDGTMVVSEGHVLGLWVFSSVFKFSVVNSKSF